MLKIENKFGKRKRILIFIITISLIFLSGCMSGGGGEDYAKADEEYYIGWILHNIDRNTNTRLGFSLEEMAVYNYSYDYPGTSPVEYSGHVFFIPPTSLGGGSPITEFGSANERVFYILPQVPKGYNRRWEFSHGLSINYLVGGNDFEQFSLDVSKTENPEGEVNYPSGGDRRKLYFGSNYKPASIILRNNELMLNDNLISINGGNVIEKIYFRDIAHLEKNRPSYRVLVNGFLDKEGELLDGYNRWDHNALYYYLLNTNVDYLVEVNIPLDYPIWSDVKIISEFTYRGRELNLPVLSYIDADSKFETGKPYEVRVGFENNNLKQFKVLYSVDESNEWQLAGLKNPNENNKFVFTINDPNVEKINLKIEAETNDGSISKWVIRSIALKARETSIDLGIYHKLGEYKFLSVGDVIDLDGVEIRLVKGDQGIPQLSVNGETRAIIKDDLEVKRDYSIIIGDYIFFITHLDRRNWNWIYFDLYRAVPSLDSLDEKETYIVGKLRDEKRKPIDNVVLDLYVNGNFIGKEITGFSRVKVIYNEGEEYEFDISNKKGIFFHEYNEIKNMENVRIKAVFEGTGVYLPKEEELNFV